ncbi:MAG: hypothetical protein M3P97_03265 [Actinomycetota bacterium]|nr:hypothetical protein [Actinomycetota bacterium]
MTKVVSGLDLRRRRRPDATAGTSTDPTDAVAVRLALGAALRPPAPALLSQPLPQPRRGLRDGDGGLRKPVSARPPRAARRLGRVSEPDEAVQSRRVPLAVLLTPIVVLAVVGTVADVIGPGLITERPLLQVFLNPRNRYLLLASPQVDALAFLTVGFVRLVLTDPLFYLLGVQYGDAALRWAERKLDDDAGFIRTAERLFSRFGSAVILLAPSGYLCLLAGATGMRPRRFVTLNVVGTVGRLVLFRVLGEAFEEELLRVLGFIQRYQWWLIALSLVVVAVQSRRRRATGTLRPPSELEEEIEAVEDELAVQGQTGPSPPASDPARSPSSPQPGEGER